MEKPVSRWENLCRGGKTCVEVGKPVSRWKDLCRVGKTCVEVEKPVSMWKDLCRGGKTCVEVEKPVSRWKNLCRVGIFGIFPHSMEPEGSSTNSKKATTLIHTHTHTHTHTLVTQIMRASYPTHLVSSWIPILKTSYHVTVFYVLPSSHFLQIFAPKTPTIHYNRATPTPGRQNGVMQPLGTILDHTCT
jgi:hypothetical protein